MTLDSILMKSCKFDNGFAVVSVDDRVTDGIADTLNDLFPFTVSQCLSC